MITSRRDFIRTAAAASAGLGLAAAAAARQDAAASSPAKTLNLLILGGTGFIGPHIIEEAVRRGHTMTLFNRGQTNADLFPDLEKLRGNRDPDVDDGLAALDGDREWDAVIDTSGFVPRIVGASARLLAPRAKQYAFVSSISVYGDPSQRNIDEDAPLDTMDDPTTETVDGRTYGPLKVLCERATEAAFPGRATIVRPGYIVGPRGPYDRLTYWTERVARGGEVLAPGDPDDPVQLIDARDLARFILHAIEQRITGPFNLVGPEGVLTMAQLLHGCKAVSGGDASFTWVSGEFLESKSIFMPIWVDPDGPYGGFGSVNNTRARDAGLTFRPLARTVADTRTWFAAQPESRRRRLLDRLESDAEAKLLAEWHDRA